MQITRQHAVKESEALKNEMHENTNTDVEIQEEHKFSDLQADGALQTCLLALTR